MGIFNKFQRQSPAIFSKFLRRRLALILTCCIIAVTLLAGSQLFLRGAQAQAGVQPMHCTTHKPCSFLASAGFSATQGLNQWDYLFSVDQEATFADMTYDSTNTRWQGNDPYCLVGSNWQHPGSSVCDSARTWVAPISGSVTLTANGPISVATNCPNSTNTSGVQIRILLNGTQIWPATGWQGIPNGGTFSFPALTTTVQAADQIHFVVAHVGSTNYCDTTSWDQLVTLVNH